MMSLLHREEMLLEPSRRRTSTSTHLVGLAFEFCGAGMILCALIDRIRGGDAGLVLLICGAVAVVAGELARRSTQVGEARSGEVFQAVAVTWIAISIMGAAPYWFSGMIPSWQDALFESVSGFSCTGSTILDTIEDHPPGLLYWRQMTQWFGGMGVIVLAVAVLPFIGVGGLDLISAEAPGPDSDRLAPRVSETARRLWRLYGAFTVVLTLVLMVAGADWYEASAHSLATVATGGFSTFNDSAGGFDSVAIELILMVAMILGGVNFNLHYRAIRRGPGIYAKSSETRAYLSMMLVVGIAVVGLNVLDGISWNESLRGGTFTVVSLSTSTGFGNGDVGDFVRWAPAVQMILLGPMLIGGMSGSTSGGAKTIRMQVMVRQALRELKRSRHPRAVLVLRQDGKEIPDSTLARISGFVLLYVSLNVAGILAVVALGSDVQMAIGGVVGSMGNMGPGFGDAGPTANFTAYSLPARWILMWLMLVGRLEIFPMLLMFTAMSRRVRRLKPRVKEFR